MGEGSSVATSCGGGVVATAPIQPLAWELPYATGAALKRQKKKKKEEEEIENSVFYKHLGHHMYSEILRTA